MINGQLNSIGRKRNQQGFSLIMALGFMVFLTLIVISMVNVSSSDEKIARNSRDKDLAFAAAEAALRDAEMYITGSYQYPYRPIFTAQVFNSSCNNALCDFRFFPLNLAAMDFFDTTSIYNAKSNPLSTITGSPTIFGVANQPRYLVEIVIATNDFTDPNPYIYRITAQGEGKSPDTRVTLQELFNPCAPNPACH